MSALASQITDISAVCSGADQRKHQSSASFAFVRGIHGWPVNSPHKGSVTRQIFPFDNVIVNTVIIQAQKWEQETSRAFGVQPRYNTIIIYNKISSTFATLEWGFALLLRTQSTITQFGSVNGLAPYKPLLKAKSNNGHDTMWHYLATMSWGIIPSFTSFCDVLNTVYEISVLIISLTHHHPHPPSAAYMRRWTRSALVQIMACRLFGANLNQCWVIDNWVLRNKLQWNCNKNTKPFIHENAFENIVGEMVAILSRGRWVNKNILHDCTSVFHTGFYLILASHLHLTLYNVSVSLTHWDRDKIEAISQTTFSSASSCMKIFDFWFKFHWSLFLRVWLKIFQHWFR